MPFLFSTRQVCIVLKSGWSSTQRMSASSLVLLPSLPLSLSPSDATATSTASSHHFTPPRQVSARLALLVSSSAFFLLHRWSETPVAAVSSSLKCRKHKVRSDVNMNVKSFIVFSGTVDELIPTFAVRTRPSSKVRSSATSHG